MDKLVFVYNADSGIVNGLMDYAHKVFSPHTYACNLCALTYGYTGMRAEWRMFLREVGMSVEFVHRDELRAKYGMGEVDLPAILAMSRGNLALWLDATTMNNFKTLNELKFAVKTRLAHNALR